MVRMGQRPMGKRVGMVVGKMLPHEVGGTLRQAGQSHYCRECKSKTVKCQYCIVTNLFFPFLTCTWGFDFGNRLNGRNGVSRCRSYVLCNWGGFVQNRFTW